VAKAGTRAPSRRKRRSGTTAKSTWKRARKRGVLSPVRGSKLRNSMSTMRTMGRRSVQRRRVSQLDNPECGRGQAAGVPAGASLTKTKGPPKKWHGMGITKGNFLKQTTNGGRKASRDTENGRVVQLKILPSTSRLSRTQRAEGRNGEVPPKGGKEERRL